MTTSHWIITADGRDHAITGTAVVLQGNTPSIYVIAHSLAQINRFTGHASRPYSVAEHSLLVCDIVASMGLGPQAQLAALMHDAHECITGDVASPIKSALGVEWLGFENLHARMLRQAYALQTAYIAHGKAIKHADLVALATERRDLMCFDPDRNLPWPVIDTPGAVVAPIEALDLNTPVRAALGWRHHRDAFLERYWALTAQCGPAPVGQQQTKATP